MTDLQIRKAIVVEVFKVEGLRFKSHGPDSLCAYPGSKLPKEWTSSQVPAYETDIAAAWTVVAEMKTKSEAVRNHFVFGLAMRAKTPWDLTPKAICVAALEAIRSTK